MVGVHLTLSSPPPRAATPLFGLSALLSILTTADGNVMVPEAVTGLDSRHRGRGHALSEVGVPAARPRGEAAVTTYGKLAGPP